MPTKYIHFTDEQKEQARQTDLCELLPYFIQKGTML